MATENVKVGRWQYWLCGCPPAQNQNVMLPSEPECRACGTVRPPLPETPAPSASEIPNDSTEDAIERIARNYVSDINFTRSVGVVDALLSYEDRKALVRAGMALRAVPVEGRPLAAAITDHPVSVEDAVKLLREAEQELSGGEGNHEILGAECGVMADRLAALATPTPSEDRP